MVGRIAQEPFDTTSSQRASMGGLVDRIDAELAAIVPRYNLAPTERAAVLRLEDDVPVLDRMIWRLIAPTERHANFRYTTINAKAETMHQKLSFKHAVRARRGVVPMTGYYEWTGKPRDKQPYFLHHAAGDVLWAACLWEPRHPSQQVDGEPGTFALVTLPAVALAATVHDRMPAFLPPADVALWMTGPADTARALVQHVPPPTIALYPVSRRVNAAGYDDPSLIDPVTFPEAPP